MQRLVVLGGLSITTDDGPLTGRAVQRRRLALLALLATARQRPISRDKLIALLWPGAEAATGRHYLSDSVYRINMALGGDVIVPVGDDLRLDTGRLPADLPEFEDAVARGDHEAAASLYGGPFLDGFFLGDAPEFERWVDEQRARTAAAFARELEALAEAAAQRGEHAVAVHWWRRLAAHDPYNSRIALRLMHALSEAGERGAAIQHARIHETLLRQELEVDPDPAVVAFAERLRTATEHPDRGSARPAVARSVASAHGAGPAANAHTAAAVANASTDPASAPPGTPLDVTPAPERTPDLHRRAGPVSRILGVAGVAGVAVLVAVWLATRGPAAGGPNASSDPMRSVAVLPFANVSNDPETEYFSDGMTEELIATLGAVEGLAVASRTSAFAYKGQPMDVREIGRKLGVDAVVEGSVRKSGDKLRVTAQLVSATTGYRLWSDAYDREVGDVFEIQHEMAGAIVTRMRGPTADSAGPYTWQRIAPDAEAYDLYLRGRFAWHQRTREGLGRAIDYFQGAVDRAPGYALAHAGLGDAYAVAAFYDYRAPRDAYPRAEASARRAIEIDPRLAAPHATLGYVLTYYHLDWPRAEAEFHRALAIGAHYSTAHQWYGNLLTVAGRFDEAERAMRRAQEADPLSLIATAALGWSFYYAGKYDAALEQCRITLALEPRYVLAHLWGGWALDALGRSPEARAWISRAVELSPGSDLARLSLAHLLARSPTVADRDSALVILRETIRRSDVGAYVPSYEIAKVYLALGDRSKALEWLDRAVEERSHSRAFLRIDPQLRSLRGDARYQRLVARAFGGQPSSISSSAKRVFAGMRSAGK